VSGGSWYLIVVFVVLIVAMYFMMIRPNRKAQQAQQKLLDSIQQGTRVMTGSGIFGTVRHLGEKQVVIEVSPGSDMTILRQAIRSVVKPEDDEFEYSDEPEAAAEPAGELPDMSAFERDVNLAGDDAAAAPAETPADQPGDDADQPTDADGK